MNRSKFIDAQISFALRQGDGGAQILEVCRKTGFAEATPCIPSGPLRQFKKLIATENKKLSQKEASRPIGRLARDHSCNAKTTPEFVGV